MLLTFAELHFMASSGAPALDPLIGPGLLDLLEYPVVDLEHLAEAGLASLVARGICRETSDPQGTVQVEFDPEIGALHAAIRGASTAIRVATVSPERSTFWLLLVGNRRAAFTPVGAGVFGSVVVPPTDDLRQQVASLVASALADDPFAGVALSRTGLVDAFSFRTNDELGGPDAIADERLPAISALVDGLFVRQHPSSG